VVILLSTLAIILSVTLMKEMITKPILQHMFTSEIPIKTITALISGAVMIGVYLILVKHLEKGTCYEFELKKAPKELFRGLVLGLSSIGSVILTSYLLGYYQFIKFESVYAFLPTFVFIIGAAILEEIIFRGLVFRKIKEWKGPVVALFMSSIIFQLPHFMNDHTGILPAILGVLLGIVVALMYADTNRLWLPIAFHFGWNIMQPAFGTTLSGVSEFTTLSQAKLIGPELLIGSKFGIEVSLLSFIVLIGLGLFYVIKLQKVNYFNRN
jgi:membrane protease YdiL (CAAX protease family)